MTVKVLKKSGTGRHGRYVARIEGIDGEGEIEFTRRGDDVISLDHTSVPDTMGGKGVAKAMLDFVLEDARANGFQIIPLCDFVLRQYAKHPEWQDLFITRPGEDAHVSPG